MSEFMPVPSERDWTEEEREEFFQRKQKEMRPPYWQCICGVKAMPLTDDTECKCNDYYDQEWSLVSSVLRQEDLQP